MKKEIICTVCPRGCHVTVEGEGANIVSVEGFGCKRGKEYASSEFTCPVRILTTTVKVADVENDLLPIRSDKPLPKDKLFDCMDVIRALRVQRPVSQYDVLIENICGTGVNMVATKDMA